MPEDTDPTLKTHIYNSSWSNPSQVQAQPSIPPQAPISSPQTKQIEKDHLDSNFPKRIIKISGLIFAIISIIFFIVVFILPMFTKKTGVVTGSGNSVTYWGISYDESVMNGVISDFEKENPDFKVTYVKQDPIDYRERLTTRVKNGTGPDIFSFHNSWYPMISDILSPIPAKILDSGDLKNDYYPITQEDLLKNGQAYGVPLGIDTLALFVNTKIFEDAKVTYPKTWQEFIDASRKLTKRDDNGKILIAGAAMGTYDNIDHAPDIISLLFAQNGVDLKNIQNSKTKVEDALQFYKNFALVENSVWDKTLDKSLTSFSQGKVAMVFGYAKDFVQLKKQNPSLMFGVVAAPQLFSANRKNIGSYWVEGISSKSKNSQAAQAFIEYLVRPDVLGKIYQGESALNGYGMPYPLKALSSKINDKDYSVFVDQANSAESTFFVDGTFDNGLNDNLNILLKDAISSDSLNKASTDRLFQGYSQVFGQFSSGL